MAELNLVLAGQQPLDKEEKKAARMFDLSKAIREAGQGGVISGLEKEMHDEGAKELRNLSGVVGNLFIPSMLIQRAYKRAGEDTKTTGASYGNIPTMVGAEGLVVANPLYRQLGATVYEGLTAGKLDLPFSKGHSAAAVAETSEASQSVPTRAKGTLSATRFQGWQNYTQEYLSESVVMPSLMADMIQSIDRGVGKSLVSDAIAVAVISGFETSGTAAALTWNTLLDIIAATISDNFISEGFVLSKELFYQLAATERTSANGKYLLEGGTGKNKGSIFGIDAFGTSFLPVHDTNKYDIVYGDWKESYVGFWGGVQLLVDPYTASDNGYVKLTWSRMGAVDSNPYAFASKRNASIS